jgi:hypothetical protein
MAGNVIAQFEPVNGLGVTVMGGDLVTGGRVAALAERSGLSSAWHRHGCAVQQLLSLIATQPLMIAPIPWRPMAFARAGGPGAGKARRQRPAAEPVQH